MKTLFASLFVIFGLSAESLARPLCSSVFTDEFLFLNTNADIPARVYSRPHFRGLEMSGLILGPTYREAVNSLKKGESVLDAGAGYGIGTIQMVQKRQVVAHAINAQDFWKFIETSDPKEIKRRVADLTESLKFDLNGLVPKSKFVSAEGHYLYGYDWDRASSQMVSNARFALVNEVRQLQQKQVFHYHAGYVEKILPQIETKFKLIQDLYGAVLYSADRMHLLDLYFEKLEVGGKAFIKLRTEKGAGVNDLVILGDGRKVDLSEYLIEKYPEIFRFGTNDRSVLVMERKTEDLDLNLEEILTPAEIKIQQFTESEYPNILWKLR